jgi:hypothetical protein
MFKYYLDELRLQKVKGSTILQKIKSENVRKNITFI